MNCFANYAAKNREINCKMLGVAIVFSAVGEMAERSNAAVLKTVEGQPSQGSNPCLSAKFLDDFASRYKINPNFLFNLLNCYKFILTFEK